MKVRAWAKSARFPAQLTILLPLALGAVLADNGWPRRWELFGLTMLFGLCDQLFIVWANDFADRDDDPHNPHPTPFAGGSRVLVDRDLSAAALARAAVTAAIGCVLLSTVQGFIVGAYPLPLLGLTAVLLLWLYSYPPVRLSYRGGGELLQMVGVGLVLPLYGYLGQGGALVAFPWAVLLWVLPLELGCALATTRPDAVADERVGKRTLAAVAGGPSAGFVMVALHGLSLGILGETLFAGRLAYVALPATLNLGAFLTLWARPGTKLMLLHTFLALFVTVSTLSVVIWVLVTEPASLAGATVVPSTP